MADRIEAFTVTVPLGTPSTSPQTFDVSFDPGDVEQLEITVPPGPSGTMGFQLLISGEPVIPYRGREFLILDDAKPIWPLRGYPTSGAWEVRAFNTDVFDHDIFLRFLVNETDRSRRDETGGLVQIAPGGTVESEVGGSINENIGEEIEE